MNMATGKYLASHSIKYSIHKKKEFPLELVMKYPSKEQNNLRSAIMNGPYAAIRRLFNQGIVWMYLTISIVLKIKHNLTQRYL